MSSGDRKKGSSKGEGWQVAKDEFYQEQFKNEVESDGYDKNTRQIRNELPSQKNRATTVNRKSRHKETRKKATMKRRASMTRTGHNYSTDRKQSVFDDNYIAMMPDLSENLSNEMSVWEEILKLKEQPIKMTEKKVKKALLQGEEKLKLQGYENFKWKRRKFSQHLSYQWKEIYSKLQIWKSTLKKIEGKYGTGVVTYFLFIKWLLYLNLVTFMFFFVFVIFPPILSELIEGTQVQLPCREIDHVEECSTNYSLITNISQLDILHVVQGTGVIEATCMFFGKYDCTIYKFPSLPMSYNLPLMYVLVTILTFTLTLIIIVKSAARGFTDKLLEHEGQHYQFCNLIFVGWDFCIQNEKTARIKKMALCKVLTDKLKEEEMEEERKQLMNDSKIKITLVRILINVIVLMLLIGGGALIYYTVIFQRTGIFKNDTDWIESLILQYLPTSAIVLSNMILPPIFNTLVKFEKYKSSNVIQITLFRIIILRLASLVILLISIYGLIPCISDNSHCNVVDCKSLKCWETFAGQQIYRLILLNLVVKIVITFFFNFPRMLIAKHCKCELARKIGEQEFDLPRHVLDVVYSQILCWLGTYFAPVIPGLTAIEMFLMFYIKRFTCLVNSNPNKEFVFASKSKFSFLLVLLLSFGISIAPILFSITEMRPSISCGPFRGKTSVWETAATAFNTLPSEVKNIFHTLTSAAFAIPLFIVLSLTLYYYYAVYKANRHMVKLLKAQLAEEGRDKQFLLNKLTTILRQQEAECKQARRLQGNSDANNLEACNHSQSLY